MTKKNLPHKGEMAAACVTSHVLSCTRRTSVFTIVCCSYVTSLLLLYYLLHLYHTMCTALLLCFYIVYYLYNTFVLGTVCDICIIMLHVL